MEQFTKDMNIIAKLDNEPNDMGGLTAEQLKAKFDEGGLALQKYINEVILPRMGEPWQGDLLMNGYRITGLGAPVNETDALRKMDAAPAGYGLGTVGEWVEDLNNAKNNGFYSWKKTALNIPFDYGCLLVLNRGNTRIAQIAIDPYMSYCGQMAVRHCSSDVWGDWEYINPPMSVDVEYKTVERWRGKPVYTKLINCGALPNNSSKNVAVGVSAPYIVRSNICVTDSTRNIQLPYFLADGTLVVKHLFTGSNLQITTNSDYSGYTAYARIWYTKE